MIQPQRYGGTEVLSSTRKRPDRFVGAAKRRQIVEATLKRKAVDRPWSFAFERHSTPGPACIRVQAGDEAIQLSLCLGVSVSRCSKMLCELCEFCV